MRRILTAFLALVLMPVAASAAEPLPHFKKYAPYTAVRAQLIRMGVEPVPVRPRPGTESPPCNWDRPFCRAFPELVHCNCCGLQFCEFVFRRRSDGRLLIVVTAGEEDGADFSGVRFSEIRRPQPMDFEDAVIANPAHRDRH